LGKAGDKFRGHEFHFSKTTKAPKTGYIAACSNAQKQTMPNTILQSGNVMGSFMHIIDKQ
jgi:cobyrinic acid a,c-diamide synthase